MPETLTTIENIPVMILAADGLVLTSERDALDIIGETLSNRVQWVIIPVERLSAEFFQLSTGLAGQIMQKFVQYRRGLVICGDISPYVAQSNTLKALVYESNRGPHIWFMPTEQQFIERLKDIQQQQVS